LLAKAILRDGTTWRSILEGKSPDRFQSAWDGKTDRPSLGPPEKAATTAGQQRWLIASL